MQGMEVIVTERELDDILVLESGYASEELFSYELALYLLQCAFLLADQHSARSSEDSKGLV
jgi:hypothetical protein